jgi:hypothetical protein
MNDSKLRGQSIALLSMLGIQFILGMILNLFIKLPKDSSGLGTAIKHGGGIVLVLHILIAVGLLIGSITLIARAFSSKNRYGIIASITGAIGIIAALTNGFAFIGSDSDVNSFIMAIGFMLAVTAYSVTLTFNAYPAKMTLPKEAEKSNKFGSKVRHSHS